MAPNIPGCPSATDSEVKRKVPSSPGLTPFVVWLDKPFSMIVSTWTTKSKLGFDDLCQCKKVTALPLFTLFLITYDNTAYRICVRSALLVVSKTTCDILDLVSHNLIKY